MNEQQVEIWTCIPYVLENGYTYVNMDNGRPVDKKSKRYLDTVLENIDECLDSSPNHIEEVEDKAAKMLNVSKATSEELKNCQLLDSTTANFVNQVWNRMTPEQQAKMRSMPFVKMIQLTWRVIK